MDKIKNTLQSLFPELLVEHISKLGSGNDSNAFLVNHEIVFKIPKHQKASDNLAKEKLLLDLIQGQVSLPVPYVQYHAILPNGFNIIGCSKLEGETLTKEAFAALTEQQTDHLAKQLAKFLKELHQIKVPNPDAFFVDNRMEIEANYKTFTENFSQYFTQEQISNGKKLFESILCDKTLTACEPVLIHNDFSASNILFDPETKAFTGIIDFGDAAVSDRDYDFLFLLEISEEEWGRAFGVKVLQCYGLSVDEINLAVKKADMKNDLWPYEEILLSNEYNDESMLESGLQKLRCMKQR